MPTLALLDWTPLVEDYLDPLGTSVESFCRDTVGGWMFGTIDALRRAGAASVLYVVSARVAQVERHRHGPTGATVCVLPAPTLYRRARRTILNPYADTVVDAAGFLPPHRRLGVALQLPWMEAMATPLATLAREMRRDRCDALLCQEYESGRFDACVALARLLRLPVFATFQGGDTPARGLRGAIRRRAIRAADGLVVGPAPEAERVRRTYGLPDSRIARIFNPLDLSVWRSDDPDAERARSRQELGIRPDDRVAVWHGRVLLHRKGLDVLLDAWERVVDADPARRRRLVLVGTGHDAAALRERLVQPPFADSVRWIDSFVSDKAALRRHLAAGDVYAFPSRHEGFPVAPVEAMACGLPVAATDAQGVPEILSGGEDDGGLVTPVGDPEALAGSLERLLGDADLSRRLGERAREAAARRFSPETVGAALRAFLLDPADRGATPPQGDGE